MRQIEHIVKDPLGIHARPAGALVKKALGFKCSIDLVKAEQRVSAKKLFAVLGLSVKCGDVIQLVLSGEDEEAAYVKMMEFCNRCI